MRALFAALALAGALLAVRAPATAHTDHDQLAQMARDVTDAVRKRREERKEPRARHHRCASEGVR